MEPLIDLIQSKGAEESGRSLAYVPYQHFREFSKKLEKMYKKTEENIKQQTAEARRKAAEARMEKEAIQEKLSKLK